MTAGWGGGDLGMVLLPVAVDLSSPGGQVPPHSAASGELPVGSRQADDLCCGWVKGLL